MPMPNAHIHELICACVAPKFCAAWKTTAPVLVNPTRTTTNPATMAGKDKSRKNCMNNFSVLQSLFQNIRDARGRGLQRLFNVYNYVALRPVLLRLKTIYICFRFICFCMRCPYL
jgi:hypothetical protein